MSGNDVLNFLVSAAIAGFSLLIGGAWVIGLLFETEKPESFLWLVSCGLLLGGIGLALNCFYLLTKKLYKWTYYLALGLLIIGYGLAVVGKSIYEQF